MPRIIVRASVGVSVFCLIVLFTTSGQAHLFALWAVAAGAAFALAVPVLRLLARFPWAEAIGIAALASFLGDTARH